MYTILVNITLILIGIVLTPIFVIIALSIICAIFLSLAIYASVIRNIAIEYFSIRNSLSKV